MVGVFICLLNTLGQARIGYIEYWVALQSWGTAGIGSLQNEGLEEKIPLPLIKIYFKSKEDGGGYHFWKDNFCKSIYITQNC